MRVCTYWAVAVLRRCDHADLRSRATAKRGPTDVPWRLADDLQCSAVTIGRFHEAKLDNILFHLKCQVKR